jgi:hypothetical protein
LPETALDEATLPRKHLGRQLTAILASHSSLNAFDNCRDGASIVLELLRTIVDADAGSFADVLVVSAFISVLKSTPTAHIVDEYCSEVRLSALDVID